MHTWNGCLADFPPAVSGVALWGAAAASPQTAVIAAATAKAAHTRLETPENNGITNESDLLGSLYP